MEFQAPIDPKWAQYVVQRKHVPCSATHPQSCEWNSLRKMIVVAQLAHKVYIPIHLAPVLLFKRRLLWRHPVKVIKNFLKNLLNSTAMMAMYVGMLYYCHCKIKNYRQKTDKYNQMLSGAVSWVMLFIESYNRRTEIALYMIPRMFESGLSFLEYFGYIKSPPNAEVLAFAVGLSVLMYFYQNESKNIRQTYRTLFQKYWGDD